MYSVHKGEKSVVAERFIRNLKNKTYKYMNFKSKNVHINKLDDIMNEHNNTCHKTIKLKPADVNPSIYIDLNKENNRKGPKFKVGNNNRTSKYKIIFAKVKVPNWSDEAFVIKKVKNTVPWTWFMMIKDKKLL